MSDKPEDVFGLAIDIFDTRNKPKGLTSVATSFSPPGPLQPDIIFEDELRMIWRSYGFTNVQINEMLKEASEAKAKIVASASNLTRTATGPFDPNKSWLDQVLDSCSLDSHDSHSPNSHNSAGVKGK